MRPVFRRYFPFILLILLSLPLFLFLLLPLLALLLQITPGLLLTDLPQEGVRQALLLSLETTLCTVLLSLLGGTPCAYLLARRRFPGRALFATLLDLPMVLPPSVAGIALLVTFGRRGMLGHYLDLAGVDIAFTRLAVIMAQTFVAAPFYVKSATGAFTAIDHEAEQAAALDGASALGVFRYITVPLAGATLFAGLIMTWARALGEFGATIIFAGNFPGRTQTMPLAIYLGFALDLPVALTLSVILLGASFAVLFLVKRFLREGLWKSY